jgi:hypothetical protein
MLGETQKIPRKTDRVPAEQLHLQLERGRSHRELCNAGRPTERGRSGTDPAVEPTTMKNATHATAALELALSTIELWSTTVDNDALLPLAVKAWVYLVDNDDTRDSRLLTSAQEMIAGRLCGWGFEYANGGEAAISADRSTAIDFIVDGWPVFLSESDRAELTVD